MRDFRLRYDLIDQLSDKLSPTKNELSFFGLMPVAPIHIGYDKLLIEFIVKSRATASIPLIFLRTRMRDF